jgi:hypothetical protein
MFIKVFVGFGAGGAEGTLISDSSSILLTFVTIFCGYFGCCGCDNTGSAMSCLYGDLIYSEGSHVILVAFTKILSLNVGSLL